MTTYLYLKNALTNEERDAFTRENSGRGLTATNDVLKVDGDDGTVVSYVVFTGSYTPFDVVRDCGDHWIYAGRDRYYKIDKATMTVVDRDAEDH